MIVVAITLATIISTILGGLFAVKFKDKLHLILGFSAGAVLGVALFDLIPESISLTTGIYKIETITVFIAFGFSIYMLVDRYFSLHVHSDHNHECENPTHNIKFGALALIIHSFLDGFTIGVAFKVSTAIGWVVTTAVLAHKFSDGINMVGMIFRNNKDNKTVYKWLYFSSIAPAIGVALAQYLTISEPLLGLILAIFVGLFLYLGASDLIPESHHQHPAAWTTLSTILGMALIYAIVRLAL